MHGEAEDFAGGFLGFREITPFVAARGEDGLLVEAFGIIDGGGDASGFQLLGYLVTLRKADGVLGIDVGVTGHAAGGMDIGVGRLELGN